MSFETGNTRSLNSVVRQCMALSATVRFKAVDRPMRQKITAE